MVSVAPLEDARRSHGDVFAGWVGLGLQPALVVRPLHVVADLVPGEEQHERTQSRKEETRSERKKGPTEAAGHFLLVAAVVVGGRRGDEGGGQEPADDGPGPPPPSHGPLRPPFLDSGRAVAPAAVAAL